jgi:hypothetical protein
MTITTRFGRKVKVPSTFQIKHELLLFWLKNQTAKEAVEHITEAPVATKDRVVTANDLLQPA